MIALLVKMGPKYELSKLLLVPILLSCWIVNLAAGLTGIYFIGTGTTCTKAAKVSLWYLTVTGLGNVILISIRLWISDPTKIAATLLPILFNLMTVSMSYQLIFKPYYMERGSDNCPKLPMLFMITLVTLQVYWLFLMCLTCCGVLSLFIHTYYGFLKENHPVNWDQDDLEWG